MPKQEQQIVIADLENFQIVSLKNFAEIYYLHKFLGKEKYDAMLDLALKQEMPDGKTDAMAVGDWWNERIASPIFQIYDPPEEKPIIILTDSD